MTCIQILVWQGLVVAERTKAGKEAAAVMQRAHDWAAGIDRAVVYESVVPAGSGEIRAARELLTDDELEGRRWDGTYYVRGVRYLQRSTSEYDHPWTARGLGSDHGVLERLYRTSPQYARAVSTIRDHLLGGHWRIDSADPDDEHDNLRARIAERALFGIAGGWKSFVEQAVISLCVAGFAIFVRVDAEDGSLKRLALRRSNTVRRWVFDDADELVGVEFEPRVGAPYMIPAEHLVVMSWGKLGRDLEGLSPLRQAAPWIRAKQLAGQLWTAGLEKWGSPIIVVEGETGGSDRGDRLQVVNFLDYASAEQFPVVSLAPGQTASMLTPGTQLAAYQEFLEYCDQQILLPLSSEGALVGMQTHGAYNLGELKDSQHLRVAIYAAQLIADAINGDAWTRHNGVVRHVIDVLLGVGYTDRYPQLRYALGDEDAPVEDILAAVQAGLVEVTPEVRQVIHERLGLPAPEGARDA